MAIVHAPLLSLKASGQIGKAVVYSTWKGVDYARTYVIPKNPQTTSQTATRDLFKWLHDQYKFMPPVVTQDWEAYVKGKPQGPGNAFMQANLNLLLGAANSDAILLAKPVASGPPTATITAPNGVLEAVVTITAATVLPTDLTVTSGIVGVMKEVTTFDEQELALTVAQEVASPGPYTYTFTSLTAAQKYIAFGFFKYTKTGGQITYGGQLSMITTPTAS